MQIYIFKIRKSNRHTVLTLLHARSFSFSFLFLTFRYVYACSMAFYLKPPRGEIHLDKIQELGLQRLRFLAKIRDRPFEEFQDLLADNLDLTDAVMENTPKDRVAHFVLKLIASSSLPTSSNLHTTCSQFRDFFLEQEMQLFSWRTLVLEPEIRHRSLCGLQRHLRQNLVQRQRLSRDLSHLLNATSEIIDQRTLFPDSESNREIHVPFHLVPNLVSKRLVTVRDGMALITKENVLPFLSIIFKQLLFDGTSDEFGLLKDDRLANIQTVILGIFKAQLATQFSLGCSKDLKSTP